MARKTGVSLWRVRDRQGLGRVVARLCEEYGGQAGLERWCNERGLALNRITIRSVIRGERPQNGGGTRPVRELQHVTQAALRRAVLGTGDEGLFRAYLEAIQGPSEREVSGRCHPIFEGDGAGGWEMQAQEPWRTRDINYRRSRLKLAVERRQGALTVWPKLQAGTWYFVPELAEVEGAADWIRMHPGVLLHGKHAVLFTTLPAERRR